MSLYQGSSKKDTSLYGCLSYSTSCNLGDNIQSLAAYQYLPHCDYWIDRDKNTIECFSRKAFIYDECKESMEDYTEQPIQCIYNSWWDGSYAVWPPNKRIDPLLISMHVNEEPKASSYDWLQKYIHDDLKSSGNQIFTSTFTEKHSLFASKHLPWWKSHGPLGCRDYTTVTKAKDAGIDAYYSSCLTLTLPTLTRPTHPKDVVIADADLQSPTLFSYYVKESMLRNATYTRHALTKTCTHMEKQVLAQELLKTYSQAALVITSRLHAALPCLAMGVPCLFLHETPKKDPRLVGLSELLHAKTSVGESMLFDLSTNPFHSLEWLQGPLRSSVYRFLNK